MAGGCWVREGLMRAWRAPLMRCRRSPRQFQNTMVGLGLRLGLRLELLAIKEGGGAKDRGEPG